MPRESVNAVSRLHVPDPYRSVQRAAHHMDPIKLEEQKDGFLMCLGRITTAVPTICSQLQKHFADGAFPPTNFRFNTTDRNVLICLSSSFFMSLSQRVKLRCCVSDLNFSKVISLVFLRHSGHSIL